MKSKLLNGKNFSIYFLVLCSIFLLGIDVLHSQEKYPARNIDLIIPWSPGGVADLVGRMYAEELSRILKVPVVPVNKPGATGTIGEAFVVDAKKDGYTLMADATNIVLSQFSLPSVPFKPLTDFTPISIVSMSPSIIFVKKDSPLKSLKDLVEFATNNPGKMKYATAGAGSDHHYNMEQLQNAAKIKLAHVPYKSGGEVLTAILGGHADFGVSVVVSVASQLRAETIRGIAISGTKRIASFPDIQTYAENGYSQHFFSNWVGFFAPAEIPKSVLDVLASASEKILKSGDFVGKIEKMGASVEYLRPDEFKAFMEKDMKTAESLAKQIKMSPKK